MVDDSGFMSNQKTDKNITRKENKDSPAPKQEIKEANSENHNSQKDKVSVDSSGKVGNEVPPKDIPQSTHVRPLQSSSENRKNDAVATSEDVMVSPRKAIETYKQNAHASVPSKKENGSPEDKSTGKIKTDISKDALRKANTIPTPGPIGPKETKFEKPVESKKVESPNSSGKKVPITEGLTVESPSKSKEVASEQETSEPIMPEWKVLEPEDKTDAVEHEICENKKLEHSWEIVAASVRGKLHAHKGIWRDDAYAYGQVDGWTIVAVSDGAGSAKISRVGAKIACEEAVGSLKETLSNYSFKDTKDGPPSLSDQKRLTAFLTLSACAARNGIIREAHNRGVEHKDMYATLLLLIHTKWKGKDVIGVLQIGDGAIGVLDKEKKCTVVGVSDHGDFSSQTVFITNWPKIIEKPYDQRVVLRIFNTPIHSIAVMCDGVADDFFPEKERLIDLFIGKPIPYIKDKDDKELYGVLRTVVKEPQPGEALKSWLRYEKKGSSDDRTLVLLYKA